ASSHPALVINELYYDAPGNDAGKEWIEFYNGEDNPVNVSGFVIQASGGQGDTVKFMNTARFPSGSQIRGKSYLVVAESPAIPGFGVQADYIGSLRFQNGDITEGGEGRPRQSPADGVRLLGVNGVVIDCVIYDEPNNELSIAGFETDSDPNATVPDVAPGHSLGRISLGVDTDSRFDWIEINNPSPGHDNNVITPTPTVAPTPTPDITPTPSPIPGPNVPPTKPGIAISPTPAYTTDALTCAVTVPSIDLNRDPVSYRYEWFKNGDAQTDLTTLTSSLSHTLPSSRTAKHEIWKCVVTPFDGMEYGESAETQVEILNSPPEITWSPPESGITGQILEFEASATDADGDPVIYTWDFGNGDAATGAEKLYIYYEEGDYNIAIIANDGEESSIEHAAVPISKAPVIYPRTEVSVPTMPDGKGSTPSQINSVNRVPILTINSVPRVPYFLSGPFSPDKLGKDGDYWSDTILYQLQELTRTDKANYPPHPIHIYATYGLDDPALFDCKPESFKPIVDRLTALYGTGSKPPYIENNDCYVIISSTFTRLDMDNDQEGLVQKSREGISDPPQAFPSLSDEWLARAKQAFGNMIDVINGNGYGDKVIGFYISVFDAEWRYNINPSNPRYGNYSPNFLNRFLCAGENYNLFSQLVPNPLDYLAHGGPIYDGQGRDNNAIYPFNTDRNVVAYQRFLNERSADVISELAKTIKEKTDGNALTMAAYGYLMENADYNPYAIRGHLGLNKLLENPYLDFIISPMPYGEARLVGNGPLCMGPLDSAAIHKKFWLVEDDCSTHLGPGNDLGTALNPNGWRLTHNCVETDDIAARNFLSSFIRGGGHYLFDNGWKEAVTDAKGGNWGNRANITDSEHLFRTVRNLHGIAEELIQSPRSYHPQIAVFMDDISSMFLCGEESQGLLIESLNKLRQQIAQTGTTIGYYHVDDLVYLKGLQDSAGEGDPNKQILDDFIRSIKIAVFPNLYFVDAERKDAIDKLKNNNRALLFYYAPGFFYHGGAVKGDGTYQRGRYWVGRTDINGSSDFMDDLTGISFSEYSPRNPLRGVYAGPFPYMTKMTSALDFPDITPIDYPEAANYESRVSPIFIPGVDANTVVLGRLHPEAIKSCLGIDVDENDAPQTFVVKRFNVGDGTYWYSAYSLAPGIPGDIFRNLATIAGCTIYNPSSKDDPIYGGGPLVGYHAHSSDAKIIRAVVPAGTSKVKVYSGLEFENAAEYNLAGPADRPFEVEVGPIQMQKGQTALAAFYPSWTVPGTPKSGPKTDNYIDSYNYYRSFGPDFIIDVGQPDDCYVNLTYTGRYGNDRVRNTGDLYTKLIIDNGASGEYYAYVDPSDNVVKLMESITPLLMNWTIVDAQNATLIRIPMTSLLEGLHTYKIRAEFRKSDATRALLTYPAECEKTIERSSAASIALHADHARIASHETLTFTYDINPGTYCDVLADAYVLVTTPLGTQLWLRGNGELVGESDREPVGTFPIARCTGAQLVSFQVPVTLCNGLYHFDAALVRHGDNVLDPAKHICQMSRADVEKYDQIPTIQLKCNGMTENITVHSHDSLCFTYMLNPGTMWDQLVDAYVYAEVDGYGNYFINAEGDIIPMGSGESVKYASFPIPHTTGDLPMITAPDLAVSFPNTTYRFRAAFVWPGQDVFNPAMRICTSPVLNVVKTDETPSLGLEVVPDHPYPGNLVRCYGNLDSGTMWGAHVVMYLKLCFPNGSVRYINSGHELVPEQVPFIADLVLPESPMEDWLMVGLIMESSMPQGVYRLEGRLYRNALPVSNPASHDITYTNPPPAISVSGVPAQVVPGQAVTLTMTGNKPLRHVQMLWNGGVIWETDITPPSPGPHSRPFTIPEVPQNYYTLLFRGWDEANQTGETGATTFVYIDTTPPTIIVDAPGSVVQGQTFTVSMSTNEYVTWIQIRFNGNIILDTGVAGAGPWPTSPTTGAHWPEGTYWFDFYARDPRGNTGHLARSIFLDDVVPPEITSVDVPSSNLFHWGDTIRLTGHFNEPINRVHKWIEGTGLNYEYDVNPSDAHTVEYTIPSNAPSGWYTARFAVRDTGYNWTETGGYFFHVVP
ncbi:MAG: lamin tail domain-containing protein, partial [Candidatus Aureabacteria bacterium]|nr:lamin tail domain-containing protein [Candidatus Auribacterota bacterium]